MNGWPSDTLLRTTRNLHLRRASVVSGWSYT